MKIAAPKALWSAAARCRFALRQLAGDRPVAPPLRAAPNRKRASGSKSGSELPHSKALRAFSSSVACPRAHERLSGKGGDKLAVPRRFFALLRENLEQTA